MSPNAGADAAEETKVNDEPVITSWVDVKELEPLLRHQHAFAQSGAGSRGTGYYVKKWTSIVGSVFFLLLVGVGTFVVAWNRPSSSSSSSSYSSSSVNGEDNSAKTQVTPRASGDAGKDAAATTSMTSTGVAAVSPVSITATTLPAPAQMPAISVRTVGMPPTVLAAQPPATASYKSAKPTLIPWEVQKLHPTYVPSRIPTFTFEYVDGGLAYGAAQADGYHPEAMEGWHPEVRKRRAEAKGTNGVKDGVGAVRKMKAEPLIRGYQDEADDAPE